MEPLIFPVVQKQKPLSSLAIFNFDSRCFRGVFIGGTHIANEGY